MFEQAFAVPESAEGRVGDTLAATAGQVRKMPSWPRSWANSSLLQLYSHRNAWANSHLLGQPNTSPLSRSAWPKYQNESDTILRFELPRPAPLALDVNVILTSPCIFHQ